MSKEYIIDLTNLSKVVWNGKMKIQVLPSVNLKIKENYNYVISGENGCGKSSLLKLIGTLSRPTSGEGHVLNKNIQNPQEMNEIRSSIGYIPENIQFDYSMTADMFWKYLHKLRFNDDRGYKNALSRFDDYIITFGLDKWKQLPLGYFSNGMRKRVLLSVWMSFQPKILLLDEFDAGIDNDGLKLINDALSEIDTTILAVSHNPDIKIAHKSKSVNFNDLRGEL